MRNSVRLTLLSAVAAAFSTAATAETTVYGKLHLSAGQISQDAAGSDTSSTAVTSHASRFGIKSTDQFAGGLTGTVQAEFEIDAAGDVTGSKDNLLKARNTFVGLKGGFGEVRVGIHDTPHKISTAKLDPFSDTYADYNNIITRDVRASNVLAYLNKFGSVGVALAYSAGDDSVTAENEGDVTSVMVNYADGPLYLTAAIENYNDVAAGGVESAPKLGLGYKAGPVALGLVYESVQRKDADDIAEVYASVQYKLDDLNTIKAAYGTRDTDPDAQNMFALGFDRKLDKKASVYALYASGTDGGLANKGKLNGDGTALVAGYVYNF